MIITCACWILYELSSYRDRVMKLVAFNGHLASKYKSSKDPQNWLNSFIGKLWYKKRMFAPDITFVCYRDDSLMCMPHLACSLVAYPFHYIQPHPSWWCVLRPQCRAVMHGRLEKARWHISKKKLILNLCHPVLRFAQQSVDYVTKHLLVSLRPWHLSF